MSKFKSIMLASAFVSGIASAAPACDGFQIKLKNNLADDLLGAKISLEGADIQPDTVQQLKAKTGQVFTVNHSSEPLPMNGVFILNRTYEKLITTEGFCSSLIR